MTLHITTVSAEFVALVVPAPPPRPSWWAGMTNEQIVCEIRKTLREMPDLPFNPESARVELPGFLRDR